MLDINFVRNNIELVKTKSEAKGVPFDENLFNQIDAKRRQLITQTEQIKSQKKKLAKEVGQLKRQKADTTELEEKSKALSAELSAIEAEQKGSERQFQDFMLNVPNLFDDSVPIGKNETENVVVREWGEKPQFDFTPASLGTGRD